MKRSLSSNSSDKSKDSSKQNKKLKKSKRLKKIICDDSVISDTNNGERSAQTFPFYNPTKFYINFDGFDIKTDLLDLNVKEWLTNYQGAYEMYLIILEFS